MSAIPVPDILNQIACAGEKGLPTPNPTASWSCARPGGCRSKRRTESTRLVFDHDILVPVWIESETPAISWDRLRVLGFFETGSTNDEARVKARRNAPEGLLVYAEKQTSGRGRKGRHGVLPRGRDSTFSLLLRPPNPFNRWPLLTHVASVALAQILKELSAEQWIPHPLAVDLKWPNDVLLCGKKAAGILLETVQQ